MKTNTLDYTLTAIFSIVNKENEVHLVAFHFHTFTIIELNYDTHDKKLLAIFKAFKIWRHYLEGLVYPIDVVIDYKTLSIFLLPRYWPKGKHSGLSTSPSLILSSGSTLVVLAPNWTLSLNNRISILKGRILAIP